MWLFYLYSILNYRHELNLVPRLFNLYNCVIVPDLMSYSLMFNLSRFSLSSIRTLECSIIINSPNAQDNKFDTIYPVFFLHLYKLTKHFEWFKFLTGLFWILLLLSVNSLTKVQTPKTYRTNHHKVIHKNISSI